MVCAFGFGVGGSGLVHRSWRWTVGEAWFLHQGVGLVGWGWSLVVCAFGFVQWVLCWPILGRWGPILGRCAPILGLR